LDLSAFLQDYPQITIATEADNADILAFFSQTQIESKNLEILYDRSPDFFAFLKLHSADFLVLIYRPEGAPVQGVATMLFRQGYVQGQIQRICYLGDLRMGFDRRGSLLWRQVYGEFFRRQKEITEFKDVQIFYTCLLNDNRHSARSLARNKKSGFAYHPVCGYRMILLLMKKPFHATTPHRNLQVLCSPPPAKILDFYAAHERSMTAGYVYSHEIPQRLTSWAPSLQDTDFLAVSRDGRLLAACALWSPRESKRIELNKLSWGLKSLFSLVRILSLGRVHFQRELKVLYVTHLLFAQDLTPDEKQEVFRPLLQAAWEKRAEKKYHFLTFADFNEKTLVPAATGFITHQVGMAIHEVTSSSAAVPSSQQEYGFEMALV
jgi:hypothetical protein